MKKSIILTAAITFVSLSGVANSQLNKMAAINELDQTYHWYLGCVSDKTKKTCRVDSQMFHSAKAQAESYGVDTGNFRLSTILNAHYDSLKLQETH